jgi:hypothetical protein
MKVPLLCSALLLTALISSLADAADRLAEVLDSLPKVKNIDQVVISPDGKRVAYLVEGTCSVVSLDRSGETGRSLPKDKMKNCCRNSARTPVRAS